MLRFWHGKEQMTDERAISIATSVLDRDEPGWATRIDTRTLNLQSMSRCVLGQLFGDYGSVKSSEVFFKVANLMGAHDYSEHAVFAHRRFHEKWVREIEARQSPLFVPSEWEREKELV